MGRKNKKAKRGGNQKSSVCPSTPHNDWRREIANKLARMKLPFGGSYSEAFRAGAFTGYDLAGCVLSRDHWRINATPPSKRLPKQFGDFPHAIIENEGLSPVLARYKSGGKTITLLRTKPKDLPTVLTGKVASNAERVRQVLVVLPLPRLVDYSQGLAYGMEKRNCEAKTGQPAAVTEALPIYEALWFHQGEIGLLINRKATAREIADFLAQKLHTGSMTYAQRFERWKPPTHVRLKSGDLISTSCKEGRRIAERHSARTKFLKVVEKTCERLGIPLPKRGQPRKKSDIG